MEIEWTEAALADMAALDKGNARRIKQAVERLAEAGAGNVKKLQGIVPPEFRLRTGAWRVRFKIDGATMRVLPSATARMLTASSDLIVAGCTIH